jgi:hypothetical protein
MAQGRTVSEMLEIARDVARKLLEAHAAGKRNPNCRLFPNLLSINSSSEVELGGPKQMITTPNGGAGARDHSQTKGPRFQTGSLGDHNR